MTAESTVYNGAQAVGGSITAMLMVPPCWGSRETGKRDYFPPASAPDKEAGGDG